MKILWFTLLMPSDVARWLCNDGWSGNDTS